eukprot:13515581-Alexandrium_andersonii.AAC.1
MVSTAVFTSCIIGVVTSADYPEANLKAHVCMLLIQFLAEETKQYATSPDARLVWVHAIVADMAALDNILMRECGHYLTPEQALRCERRAMRFFICYTALSRWAITNRTCAYNITPKFDYFAHT